jgi:hypothetical protein
MKPDAGWSNPIALLALSFAAICAGRADAAPRIEVPIHQTRLAGGALRYSVPITIGTTIVEAMLDSGSSGVRVLPGAVADTDVALTARADDYSFTSGVSLSGQLAEARITIGGLATDLAVPVQMVSAKQCHDERRCRAAGALAMTHYGIGGDGVPDAGFKVMLGVNMADAPAVNPLTRIGDRAWIIILPRPGEAEPGKLILNPTPEERAGYGLKPVDPQFRAARGNFHDAIPGCLARDDRAKVCGPTVLDTGAPGIQVSLGANDRALGWKPGEAALLVFQGPAGKPVAGRFVVGSGPGARITETPGDGHPRTRIAAGILPFYAFTVLYDDKAGKIGLKPR